LNLSFLTSYYVVLYESRTITVGYVEPNKQMLANEEASSFVFVSSGQR
jgi:hypothetical protein